MVCANEASKSPYNLYENCRQTSSFYRQQEHSLFLWMITLRFIAHDYGHSLSPYSYHIMYICSMALLARFFLLMLLWNDHIPIFKSILFANFIYLVRRFEPLNQQWLTTLALFPSLPPSLSIRESYFIDLILFSSKWSVIDVNEPHCEPLCVR